MDEENAYLADPATAGTLAPEQDHFPLCILWTPLPVLTWFLPFVGHLGISTSTGEIHDFAGPYYVNRHPTKLGFGRATKYWPIDEKDIHNFADTPVKSWDESIQRASQQYDNEMHNICCNNCHDHVSMALNELNFRGIRRWNTLLLIMYMIFFGKFVSFKRFLQTYLGFFILLIIVVVAVVATRLRATA